MATLKKEVNISNIEDLKRECEIRYDCLEIVDKIDEAGILEEVLQYFEDLQYDCDDIYEFFIFEVGDFSDLLKLLFTDGYITSEQLTAIVTGDYEDYEEEEEE